jgi:hypothetical protein
VYFEDLTPYEYDRKTSDPNIVNVGWLSRDHAFQTGDVSSEFLEALRTLVASPVNLCRGYHFCEYCPQPETFVRNGLRMMDPQPEISGNGEVRITGTDGRTYVAPVLVRHYIEAHHYRPPDAFIDAVFSRV